MRGQTFVTLYRVFNPRTASWSTTMRCSKTPPDPDAPGNPLTLARFAVEGPVRQSSAEAIGVVVEWLYRGRPAAMTVTEITADDFVNGGAR